MFSKKQRLSKKKEVDAVFNGDISAYTRLFGLKAKKNTLQYSRFTVIISTKVSKLAVERNRIKRVIKNTLKKHNFTIKMNVDCVIIVLKEAKNTKTSEITNEIKLLLRKTKLI